ncbi:uncharacterized protein LOC116262321 [Nymphaea colorata]|uniref:uncharacterized protein LOC116262321 n=1 Tax=Nymphaea colorata TaxID=210225 RepID=UPI00129E39F0|nr:uncharacterized protein LOC116262321 [Nymphaea colorata]
MAMPWTSSSDAYGSRCLKHPDRRPSPGVCSLCLKERLAHLSSCKPSYSSSASLSLSSPNSHHSSRSTSSSFLDYSSSSPSTPSRPPPASSSCAAAQPRSRMSYLIHKEGRFTERSGRLWPLRRSSSAAFEVKKSNLEKKQKKIASGDGGGGNGLWSLLLLKRRKEVAEEDQKARSRSWRLTHPKTVKDIIPLGVI